jgi:hypothetical protein
MSRQVWVCGNFLPGLHHFIEGGGHLCQVRPTYYISLGELFEMLLLSSNIGFLFHILLKQKINTQPHMVNIEHASPVKTTNQMLNARDQMAMCPVPPPPPL